MLSRIAFVLGLAMLGSTGSASASAEGRYYVEVADLKRYINMGDIDRLTEVFNYVKRMHYQGEILPFIRDLWDEREDKHPNMRWEVARKPIVKVELADILVQAERNGLIAIDKERVRQFLTTYLSAEDVQVVRRAILVLGPIDDERDVPAILAIAKQEREATFRVSAIVLSKMCNKSAAAALDELEPQLKRDDFRAYLKEIRTGVSAAYKDRFCR